MLWASRPAAPSSQPSATSTSLKKLENRLVLLEYWKAVAAQRETKARQVLTDARAQHESDLAEISDELKKAKLGSLSLDLLAALLVGLSIGFTVAADWWTA
jgi:hypothetical protein